MKTSFHKADLYARVTDRIVQDLERGVRPWMKPWHGGGSAPGVSRPLRHNGQPYSGINVVLLWSDAVDKGFIANMWMTYKQANALGAQVRKGEQGSLVVYADRYTKTETNDQGDDVARDIAFMKAYTVFNVEQIDGLPGGHAPAPQARAEKLPLIAQAEAFFEASGATFRHGGAQAFYAPARDIIQLPLPEAFNDAESYAATKAHELIHWTAHERRLAREFGKRFGDRAYACEELVAELGAAFLCADLGISATPREDHAAYLAQWLEVLKQDKRAIFTAAAQAQRAADFLQTVSGAGITSCGADIV